MILGCIGDDFTGSSDLGLMLAHGNGNAGMKTVQYVGVPKREADDDVDAGIVALKSRSIPVHDAVAQSLDAYAWLKRQGCTQFFFKYCSTFDSTPQGNIGPVIDALINVLETSAPVIVCPAFPATGRTIYQGHLFVGDKLLSESGMQDHPVTPMTDSDIRRWLQLQIGKRVGHVGLNDIRAGKTREALNEQVEAGNQIVICDAVEDNDLMLLGRAAKDLPLITGGSGIAMALPELLSQAGKSAQTWLGEQGPALAISGSCSRATRNQIKQHAKAGGAQLKLNVADVIELTMTPKKALAWATAQTGLPLVYSSDDPEKVKQAQQQFGAEQSASVIEKFFGDLAALAFNSGYRRIISAGGETSGAVVNALEVDALEIGTMIDPGVPALRVQKQSLVLALKSGNFGAPDFFMKANEILAAG